jgi:hypothetical protein
MTPADNTEQQTKETIRQILKETSNFNEALDKITPIVLRRDRWRHSKKDVFSISEILYLKQAHQLAQKGRLQQ